MDYSEFLRRSKSLIHDIEYGLCADEYDALSQLKQVIIDRQKEILGYQRRPKGGAK